VGDLPFDVVEGVSQMYQIGIGGRGRSEQGVLHRHRVTALARGYGADGRGRLLGVALPRPGGGQLQGRGAQVDIDEETLRFGVGIAWQPTKNWTISGTYDLDDIQSEEPLREQNRDRYGVSASFTF